MACAGSSHLEQQLGILERRVRDDGGNGSSADARRSPKIQDTGGRRWFECVLEPAPADAEDLARHLEDAVRHSRREGARLKRSP